MGVISIVNVDFKPTYNWGGHHLVVIHTQNIAAYYVSSVFDTSFLTGSFRLSLLPSGGILFSWIFLGRQSVRLKLLSVNQRGNGKPPIDRGFDGKNIYRNTGFSIAIPSISFKY